MENNQNKTSVHIYQEPLPRLNKEIRCSLPEPFSSSKINNRKLIKNLIKETIGNEASQAFIRIFDSKYLGLKIFWLISLLGCGSLSFYLVAETLFIYLSYPVYTTTKIVYEVPTVFPKVTICNAMPAITEYAYDLIKDINVKHYPNISIFNQDQVSELSYDERDELFWKVWNMFMGRINSREFSDLERKKLAHSPKDFLRDCQFNSQVCNASEFIWKLLRVQLGVKRLRS